MLVTGAIVVTGFDGAGPSVRNKAATPTMVISTAASATHFHTFGEFAATGDGVATAVGPVGRGSPIGSLLAGRRAATGSAFPFSSASGKARSAFTDVWSCSI